MYVSCWIWLTSKGAGNETVRGDREVSRPLAFVNCMSHIIPARTVNWKRSRGFAVLMSFPWTQVIIWIPEEPLQLFISRVMWSYSWRWLLSHLLHFAESIHRGMDVLLEALNHLSFYIFLSLCNESVSYFAGSEFCSSIVAKKKTCFVNENFKKYYPKKKP